MVPTSASDWESKKHIIRELYINQDLFLNEVIEIMTTKYNFKATYVLPFKVHFIGHWAGTSDIFTT